MCRSVLVLVAAVWPLITEARGTQELAHRGPVAARELLVRVRAGATTQGLRALERRAGVRIVEESTMTATFRVAVQDGVSLVAMADLLAADPFVAEVAFNSIARAAQVSPDDPLYPYQWNLDAIGAYENGQPDATGVTVALLDTGVDQAAPDLAGVSFAEGYDFVNGDADATDDHQHGTHLAGIIGQATNNSLGSAGLAVGATILPIKVLDDQASGDEFAIIDGIAQAVADGAAVLNLSFEFGAGYVPSRAMEDTIADALDAGVVVVGAAGNGGLETVSYPAAFPGVIAVGAASLAVGENGEAVIVRAPYSNYGPEIDVLAPGGDLATDVDGDGVPEGILAETFSPEKPGTYEPYLLEGTSGASAHVSAAAALLLASGTLSADVPDAISQTAVDLGEAGYDMQTGSGIVYTSSSEIPVPPQGYSTVDVSVIRDKRDCTIDATATVTVLDQNSEPVQGASVMGRWGGDVTQVVSGTTDPDGVMTSTSPALVFEPDHGPRRRRTCSMRVELGTMFGFQVGRVVTPTSPYGEPLPIHPAGWYLANLRPGRGLELRGAGISTGPMALDYVDIRPEDVERRMDGRLLEPFGIVLGGGGGRGDRNDLGRIRGAVINPYVGWALPVHDIIEAESVVFGGGQPDPNDLPRIEELDAEWQSFNTGIAVFSRRRFAAGGGQPDPNDLPGVRMRPDAPVMLDALEDGSLIPLPPPPATDAARLVPLSAYLQ